jgi:phage terminase large subunit-like protein
MAQDKFIVRQTWDGEKKEWTGAGPLALFPFQQRILEHCLTPDANGILPYSTIVYSCPKKSGKSALAGAVGAWAAEQFDPGSEIYVVASSQEQAEGRVMRDAKYHVEHVERWNIRPDNMVTAYKIQYPNDTYIQALAKSYKAAAGSRHSLSLWDELWSYLSPLDMRMWAELTPIPTVKNSIQFIATYAGFENESELLWSLYTKGVSKEEHPDGRGAPIPGLEDLPCWSNGRLFVYWDHENRMPWQTDTYLSQQLAALRAAEYLRFHENRWVTSHEEFIPAEWWDRAAKAYAKDAIIWNEHPYRTYPVYMGLDAATKHDCIAAVGVCYDGKKGDVIQLFHRIWTPDPKEPFDFETTIEPFLLDIKKNFNLQAVGYDPKDMHQTSVRLARAGVPMIEYTQSPSKMTEASHALYEVLRADNFRAYPSEEMRDHLRMAVAEAKGRGYTIQKEKARSARPVDAAVALAMAVKLAIVSGGVDASVPIRVESAFSDRTAWGTNTGANPPGMPKELIEDE